MDAGSNAYQAFSCERLARRAKSLSPYNEESKTEDMENNQ